MVALGLVIPFIGEAIEYKRGATPGRATALFVLAGGFALRWIVVFAGQASGWISTPGEQVKERAMHAKNYWNPYLAGLLLGLVLLATFLVAGQGLGASAFPKRVVALAAHEAAPAWTERNPALSSYVAEGANPLHNWLVIEVIGVLLGGFIGALSAGRLQATVERGPRISAARPVALAFAAAP